MLVNYIIEVDFVAMKRTEKLYIQVADNIDDDKTPEREVRPLLKIKDENNNCKNKKCSLTDRIMNIQEEVILHNIMKKETPSLIFAMILK